MDNLKNLTRVNMTEDETKTTELKNPTGALQTMSQICLTDKDIDEVLAEYSDSIKNLIKSESEDLLSTILDSLDQEKHEVTPEVVNRTNHDPDNILSNETNELIGVENLSLNATQNLNLMEDISNKGAETFQKDQDEKLSNSSENIKEYMEISVPAYDNDESLKGGTPDTTENPFKGVDIKIDESIYALDLNIAQFENNNEYHDDNNYDQIQNATDVVNYTDMIHIDFEEYIPVYTNLNTAQTGNQVVDASTNLRSGTSSQLSFRKEANLQTTYEINFADNAVVSLHQSDYIILPDTSDISNSDEDDIPISKFKNCSKNNKLFFGITNKTETISTDSEGSDKDDDPCNGYHSSDFEFISENEAEMDGIISANKDTQRYKKHPKKAQTTSIEKLPGASTEIAKIQNNQVFLEDPNLPGPSYANRNYYSPDRNQNNEFRNRNNHRVPEGDNYLALFQGIYDLNIISAMENKSIYCSGKAATMHIEFEGIGFDMRVMNERNRELDIDDENKEEADETSKRIMQMYPDANKKHRRRRF